jgi:hypothetical protein
MIVAAVWLGPQIRADPRLWNRCGRWSLLGESPMAQGGVCHSIFVVKSESLDA